MEMPLTGNKAMFITHVMEAEALWCNEKFIDKTVCLSVSYFVTCDSSKMVQNQEFI
jgi:hypothetical protein